MEAVKSEKKYTLEDYFELEKSKNEKFEFCDGIVWSMSGASFNHNMIVRNLNTETDMQLREKGCTVFPSDMWTKVPAYSPYHYPDLTALFGEAEIEKIGGLEMLANPQLIFEVLSDSTEAFDRGDKFSFYKSIESFTEYILVAQHRPHITQFVKQGDGFWMQTEFNDLEDVLELKSVPCILSLKTIYRDVEFPSSQVLSERERNTE